MGEEATLFLTGQGVRVVGTDAWSWDAPFSHTARRYAAEGDPKIIWEDHKAGRIRSYYQMEKLHELDQLPDYGSTMICFHVTVARGSAGWTRAAAILEEELAGTPSRSGFSPRSQRHAPTPYHENQRTSLTASVDIGAK